MSRYVAFLRGINVGGHRVVKKQLQEAFTSLGFQNISTYKQSGNVIFETSITNPDIVKTKIQEKLQKMLGYEVVILLRTIPQLKNVLDFDPFRGQNKEGASFLVTFLTVAPAGSLLQMPLTIPRSTAQMISAKDTEVFSVTHGDGEGALPNSFLEAKLKMRATTRNINIISEIVKKHTK